MHLFHKAADAGRRLGAERGVGGVWGHGSRPRHPGSFLDKCWFKPPFSNIVSFWILKGKKSQ